MQHIAVRNKVGGSGVLMMYPDLQWIDWPEDINSVRYHQSSIPPVRVQPACIPRSHDVIEVDPGGGAAGGKGDTWQCHGMHPGGGGCGPCGGRIQFTPTADHA